MTLPPKTASTETASETTTITTAGILLLFIATPLVLMLIECECTPSVIRDTRQPSICHVRSMSARTTMVSSRRSLRAVIGGAASLVISNPDHTKKGLRPTTAELIRVKRHKFPDAHRRPAGHALHFVRQPVIPTRPVQRGHRHQMPGQMLRQPRPFQLPFPILGGDVRVRDLTVQRVRGRIVDGHGGRTARPHQVTGAGGQCTPRREVWTLAENASIHSLCRPSGL